MDLQAPRNTCDSAHSLRTPYWHPSAAAALGAPPFRRPEKCGFDS